LEKVALHYGAKDEAMRFVLVEVKENLEKPIGYFQYYLDYFASDGLIGIDQFIGEENYLNKGVGTNTIKMFVEMIVRQHNPTAIIIDPSPENKRAIRCYEKVGFEYYETKKDENGDAAYMMRLEIR
jgi:RimJ/RimL family protein N-acetyltransferase